VSHVVLYLSRRDVEQVHLPMSAILEAVEGVFREKGLGKVEMPPKIGIHPTQASFLHAMPALVASEGAVGIKWVSNFGENSLRGLPTISGLLILNDPDTGFPTAIMDCTWITAKRTGAASAVAAKYLARRDAECLAIIGCGVQGRSHVEAMLAAFPGLRQITAYDLRPDAVERYVADVAGVHSARVRGVPTCEAAVRDADIIVSATEILRQPAPIIRPEWIKPGAFCMPIDFDAQFTPEAIHAMDLVYTDDVPQMDHYRAMGYFRSSTPPVQGDLADVVVGRKPARQDPTQRTMAMHLGLAIEDMVTAILVYARAKDLGLGTRLPL
jgi:ornithine cyclodeaminase/alanine dehydrogenase-like protein (mu-crystallin family)